MQQVQHRNGSHFWERTGGLNGHANQHGNQHAQRQQTRELPGYVETPRDPKRDDDSDCFCKKKTVGGMLPCRTCNKKFHRICVIKTMKYNCLEKAMWKKYLCGVCRIFKMDPFSSVERQLTSPVAIDSRRPEDRTLHLHFALPPDLRGYIVQIRSISLDGNIHTGPAWPVSVDAFVNNKRAFRVEPPKYLHSRREQNYDISNSMQGGKINEVEMNFVFDKKQSLSFDLPKVYLIGIFVVEQVANETLSAEVRKRPKAHDDRYKRVLAKLTGSTEDEVACVSHAAGRTMDFVDPVSHCRIQTPVIGMNCVHLQTFDLESYIHVNSLTRSLSTRWKCPVCNAVVLPEDIIIDSFMSRILSSQKGNGKVVIKDDGGWEVILDDAKDVCNLDDSESESSGGQNQQPQQQMGEQSEDNNNHGGLNNEHQHQQHHQHQQQQQQQHQRQNNRGDGPPNPKLPVHALPRKAAAAPVTKATPTPMRRDIPDDYHHRPSPYNEPSPKRARTEAAPPAGNNIIEIIDSD